MTDRPPSVAFDYVRPAGRRISFEAALLHADHEVLVISQIAHPSKTHHYAGQAVIEDGYDVVWFLFQGRPYDIGRFYRPDGTWTGYYVDILEPVQWDVGDPLAIAPLVDLALDLWIAPDGSYQVLDEDEYAAYVDHGALTSAQASQARSALNDLIASLADRTFPPSMVQHFRWDSAEHATHVPRWVERTTQHRP